MDRRDMSVGESTFEMETMAMPPLEGNDDQPESLELEEEVAGRPVDGQVVARADDLAALEAFDEIEEPEQAFSSELSGDDENLEEDLEGEPEGLYMDEDLEDLYGEDEDLDGLVDGEDGSFEALDEEVGEEIGIEESELAATETGDTEDEMQAMEVSDLAVESEALAEDLAAAAAAAPSDSDAQSLVGGITIHIIAPAPFQVKSVAPIIIRRNARLVRVLRRSPKKRVLIRTIPTITRRTVATLARKVRKGKPVTARTAIRVLKKHTRRTLASRRLRAIALARHRSRRRALQRVRRRRTRPSLARVRRRRRTTRRRARRLA